MQPQTITYNEFVGHLSKYINLVNTGKEFVVQMTKDSSFKISPNTINDEYVMTKEDLLNKITLSEQQIKEGKCHRFKTYQEFEKSVDAL